MSRLIQLFSGPLGIRFHPFHDRLSHEIGFTIDDSFIAVLESVEGTPAEAWPSSPPMQQMVEESIGPGNQPVLLGVGLSGNGHWSMAIEGPTPGTLKLDIACKNSKGADWFGSQYRLATGAQRDTTQEGRWIIESSSAGMKLELNAVIGELHFEPSANQLKLTPRTEPQSIATHRWCFEVHMVG